MVVRYPSEDTQPASIVIAGGGIVGLVMAMTLKKQLGITAEIYEKAHAFADDVGAGLGMYPNGLRVLRDISPQLLKEVRNAGYSYEQRRWERHDGTIITEAEEAVLNNGEVELDSIGIRRWKLQKVLYEHAKSMGIAIQFSKATVHADQIADDLVRVHFDDGTTRLTHILFGCDGGKSAVRGVVADEDSSKLAYTGITCLMGISEGCEHFKKGISFPSSNKDVHAVFFPTGKDEQCFQFHIPIDEKNADKLNWGNLSQTVGQQECAKLAIKLRKEGWHERFVEPLEHVTHAVRVGFALLEPKLETWVKGRMVLVGDAAHPPVPYIGQGAQQGMEDVGVCVALLKHCCWDGSSNQLKWTNFDKAMKMYEKIRVKRSGEILDFSKELGDLQASRTGISEVIDETELFMKADVLMYGTLPMMFRGADHDYKEDASLAIKGENSLPPSLERQEGNLRAFEELMGISEDQSVESSEKFYPNKVVAVDEHGQKVTARAALEAMEAIFGFESHSKVTCSVSPISKPDPIFDTTTCTRRL